MMTKNKSPFEIPTDVRKMTEQSMEQVRTAINGYLQFFQRAVPGNVMGGNELSNKALNYAERNVASAFEFAQKLVQVKDVQDLVKLQTEFIQSQMQAMTEQAKDLSETATKVMEAEGGGDLSEIVKIRAELRKDWQNDPIVPLCIRILEFVCSVPEDQLGRLTFGSFLEPLHKDRIDDELMRALTILVSSRVAALDARVLLLNNDQSQHELSVEELAEARATGQLVHPQTGEMVPELEGRMIPFFVPSARLRGARLRGARLRRARLQS